MQKTIYHIQKRRNIGDRSAGNVGKTCWGREEFNILNTAGDNLHIFKRQSPNDMAKKGNTLESRFDQGKRDGRVGCTTGESGKTCAGADIQEMYLRTFEERKKSERIKKVVFDDRFLTASLGYEVDLSVPPLQLQKIEVQALDGIIIEKQTKFFGSLLQPFFKSDTLFHTFTTERLSLAKK